MNVSMEMLAGKLGLPVARTHRGEDWDALCLTGWSVVEGGPHTLRLAPADDLEEAAPDGPLLLARDRDHGLRYDGSLVYPPDSSLWG